MFHNVLLKYASLILFSAFPSSRNYKVDQVARSHIN